MISVHCPLCTPGVQVLSFGIRIFALLRQFAILGLSHCPWLGGWNGISRNIRKQKLGGPPVATFAVKDHLMTYTSLNVCAMGPNEFAEDAPNSAIAANGAVESV